MEMLRMSMNCQRQSERDLAKFFLLLGSVGKKEKPECPCAGKIRPSLPGALQGELWEFVQLNIWVSDWLTQVICQSVDDKAEEGWGDYMLDGTIKI